MVEAVPTASEGIIEIEAKYHKIDEFVSLRVIRHELKHLE